jgi:hypothetical protein
MTEVVLPDDPRTAPKQPAKRVLSTHAELVVPTMTEVALPDDTRKAPRPPTRRVTTHAELAVPTMSELVLPEDQLDIVDEAPPEKPPSRPAVARHADEDNLEEDDVVVVDDAPEFQDDVVVIDDEVSNDDIVEVEDDEVDLATLKETSDPFDGQDIPASIRENIRGQLAEGEQVIWVGRPSLKLLRRHDSMTRIASAVLIAVGLGSQVGIALALTGLYLVVASVFALAFTAFGIVGLLLPILHKRKASKRSVYVLTDRRALVWDSLTQIQSYAAGEVKDLRREEDSRLPGAGDLIFDLEDADAVDLGGPPASKTKRGRREKQIATHGFEMLEDVEAVEKLVRETLIDWA